MRFANLASAECIGVQIKRSINTFLKLMNKSVELEMGSPAKLAHQEEPSELSEAEQHSLKTRPPMSTSEKWNLVLFIVLYFFNGIPMGLLSSFQLLLAGEKASQAVQAAMTMCRLPLSMKVFFATALDSFFSNRIGRRRTYILPCFYMLGMISVTFGYYNVDNWIKQLQISPIITLSFFMVFLVGISGIAINGWALTSFSEDYVHLSGTCMVIGGHFGSVLGYTLLLNLTSEYFASTMHLSEPIINMNQLLMVIGFAIVVGTAVIQVATKEQQSDENPSFQQFVVNMRRVFRLFDNRNFVFLILFLMTRRLPFSCVSASFSILLVEMGFPESQYSTLALFGYISVMLASLVAAKVLQRGNEMTWTFNCFIPIFILNGIKFLFVVNFLKFGGYNETSYYTLVIIHMLSDFFVVFQQNSVLCFIMKICDPKIGASYTALLFCASQLGFSLSESLFLLLLNYFPYQVLVFTGWIFGIIYLILIKRRLITLQYYEIASWKVRDGDHESTELK